MAKVRVGQKVAFTEGVDYAPHATIEKGETGTVMSTDDAFGEPAVEVKLDTFHFGLSEWMNTVLLVGGALAAIRDLIG